MITSDGTGLPILRVINIFYSIGAIYIMLWHYLLFMLEWGLVNVYPTGMDSISDILQVPHLADINGRLLQA